jgi:hypothetical protein
MKAIGSVIKAPLKLLGLIPKMPKPPAPVRPVTRDDARDAALRTQDLYGRRGGSADRMTGTGGAEAGSTSNTQLG